MKELLYYVTLITIMMFVLYFAFIGLIFTMVKNEPVSTDTCDKIVRVDNKVWCMAHMDNEFDDVRVMRIVNPQLTVDWRLNAK